MGSVRKNKKWTLKVNEGIGTSYIRCGNKVDKMFESNKINKNKGEC